MQRVRTDPLELIMQPLYSTVPLAPQVNITHQHLGRRVAAVLTVQQTCIHLNVHLIVADTRQYPAYVEIINN